MKITIIVDKIGSAIYRLALPIQKYNPHLNIQICDLHPKRPSEEQLKRVITNIQDSDIVDIHYWKSGELIKEYIKDKKKILFHFNPYDLDKKNWEEYQEIIVGNEEMVSKLPKARLIPYGVDTNFFKFNDNYLDEKQVLMVANRIESQKGILEVAQACKELGFEFWLVGSISDGAYFESIMKTGVKMKFYENISDEELRDVYYKSTMLVCNSKNNFESGTLPVLEAMSCGVPVLTRIVGHVPDLYNGDNMMINPNDKEDVNSLREKILEFYSNKNLRVKYREKAWSTIKNRIVRKMARQISSLYYKMLSNMFVSVVIPTFDRPKVLVECIEALIKQDYPHIEIVISDSGNTSVEPLVNEIKKFTKIPIKYIRFENKGDFTLPKARNLGVVEAQGEFLMFIDERIKVNTDVVTQFVFKWNKKTWLYGIKNNSKKDFVENFSFIQRREFVLAGMFNERIDVWGGASEELRRRFGTNGFIFEQILTAQAIELAKSASKHRKKEEVVEAKFKIYKLYS